MCVCFTLQSTHRNAKVRTCYMSAEHLFLKRPEFKLLLWATVLFIHILVCVAQHWIYYLAVDIYVLLNIIELNGTYSNCHEIHLKAHQPFLERIRDPVSQSLNYFWSAHTLSSSSRCHLQGHHFTVHMVSFLSYVPFQLVDLFLCQLCKILPSCYEYFLSPALEHMGELKNSTV